MSKMSQLSEQLDELCRCGEALIGVANSLREMFSGEEKSEAAEAEPAVAAEKPKSKAKTKQEPEAELVKEEKKALTLEDVRTILAEKSRAGFTEQVREIIAKHGAKKLSEIDPAEYETVIAEVEVL